MATVRLAAEDRTEFGKGAARRLRREGLIPAVMYGDGGAVRHVALPGHDLALALAKPKVILEVEIAGSVTKAKPRDVQRDPVRRSLEHIDLIVLTGAKAAERGREADAAEAAEAAAAAEES